MCVCVGGGLCLEVNIFIILKIPSLSFAPFVWSERAVCGTQLTSEKWNKRKDICIEFLEKFASGQQWFLLVLTLWAVSPPWTAHLSFFEAFCPPQKRPRDP